MAFLDTYRQQAALLIRTIPFVAKEAAFALKGGRAGRMPLPATSASEFVESILARSLSPDVVTSYRGHGSTEFKLQPSIFRKAGTKENEHILLRELIAAHPEDFHGDTSALETLVRMQQFRCRAPLSASQSRGAAAQS